MAVTIYDVAKKAGVSTATVSRVINKLDNVKPKTERKVLDAMKALNFAPNTLAQNFATNRSKIIGLVTTLEISEQSQEINNSTNSFYFTELFRGINIVLQERGYDLLIINANEEVNGFWNSLIQKKRIDGLIVSMQISNTEAFRKVIQEKLPLVYVGKILDYDQGMHVYAHYYKYTDQILRYFYENGHYKILFISYREQKHMINMWEQLNFKSYNKMEIDYIELPVNSSSDVINGMICEIYSHEKIPTAIFVDELSVVQPIMSILNSLGYAVPEDVSMISVEHIKGFGNSYYPRITNVHVPVYEMGKATATLLLDYIEGKETIYDCQITLESELIQRDSVKPIN